MFDEETNNLKKNDNKKRERLEYEKELEKSMREGKYKIIIIIYRK